MASTYSTWDFYFGTYGGKLPKSQYEAFALRAKAEIDRATFGRAAAAQSGPMKDNLALCECELVDALHAYSEIPKGVASVNNDGLAVTYVSATNTTMNEPAAATRICRKHLTMPENLMFAGAVVCNG